MSKAKTSRSSASKPSEATVKRRKLAAKSASTMSVEGETADDVITHFGKGEKKNMYEAISGHARIVADGFQKNLEKNLRMPVPLHEKRRCKLDKDEDYVPAQYVKLENSEYVMMQAPNATNTRELWRLVWQDQIKVMVCLCNDDQIGEGDEKKCHPYFPAEQGQSKEIELKKGKFVVTCKGKEGLSFGAIKYDLEMAANDVEGVDIKREDDPSGAGGKVNSITLYHMNTWNGKSEKEGFEHAHNVALLCREIFKAEMTVMRKSMENFVPPVLIQSFDAIGRAAIVWIGLMLLKDVEKRECFDVPELVKKIMKMRPGCISNYFQFCFTFAVSLWIAKDANWLAEGECNSRISDLVKGYADRKVNEAGCPI